MSVAASKAAPARCQSGPSAPGLECGGFEEYFELLRKWNRKVSLTSLPVEDYGDEAIDRLLLEPVLACRHLPAREAIVIDIGSGGGSPAIPMKLAVPELSMTLVESKTRKAAFLREAVRCLSLYAVVVEAVRFEELLARPDLHEAADAVTVRAVRLAPKVLAGLQAFIRPGGLLFMFQSGAAGPKGWAVPQLASHAAPALLPQWGSRLEILQKVVP